MGFPATFVSAAFLFGAIVLQAQPPAGEIRLDVRDATGAALRAAGRLENAAAGVHLKFQTDANGHSVLQRLPFGHYRLEVSRMGFATQTVAIDVTSAVPLSRAITLPLAAGHASVEVVAVTPLAGVNLAPDQVASPVQTASAADLQNSGAADLSQFLNLRLNGISLNDMAGNPYQPDINFRGYTASPLLGTPEGISVYLDGVRQNQPFGDVVSWDLIPENAIAEMTLMPGSDPLFGLNTLGGALAVQTKNGITNPGFAAKVTYGSSGRKAIQGEYGGGRPTGFNWFVAGNVFHESGWRFDSPSDVRQGFVRLGWRGGATDLALTTSYAYNTLVGNALQDYRLLAVNYTSVYSIPDSTENRSPSFNFIVQHTFSSSLSFSGNAWYRNIRTATINANVNSDALGESIYQPSTSEQAVLAAAGYTGFPVSGATAANTPFPKWRCIAQALVLGDPDQRCDGTIVYSKELQNEYGASGQVTWAGDTRAGRNQLTAGAAIDRGSVAYTQNTDFGYINPDYTVTGVGAWQDGSTSVDGAPVDSRVSLHGLTPNWSAYVTDTLTVAKTVNLTVSGRYNSFRVDNADRINPVAGPGSLDGNYLYQRFDPAIGLTWSPLPSVNTYVSYTEGSRAPTAIELGCADPNNPCTLPNAFSSDPPLQQVVTGTWEAGVRGTPELSFLRNLSWNAGAFRAENRNDILFVSAVQTGTGYFQNFAKTRREGFDADVRGRVGRVSGGLNYTFLLATYQSTEAVNGSANSTSDMALSGYPGLGGNIYVHPGNRIPLIPKQNGKAYVNVQATSKMAFDLDLIAVSSAYARGNENNAYVPDGKYYLGPGVTPGYAVVNVLAHYDLRSWLQLGVQTDNLLNRHYYTAAQLANTMYNSAGAVVTRPFAAYGAGPEAGNYPVQSVTFLAPGAPRRVWVELRVRF
jgi:outer membrane receptor protein involved in Fe transport